MSKIRSNPLMDTPKKKHHLWGLWIPLILIFAIVIAPVGLAALLFYDPHHVDTGITKENVKEESKVFGSIMTNMFDNCRSEKDQTMDLKITQNDLNNLLFHVANNEGSSNEFIKQFSVNINQNSYEFDVEISMYNIVKTHLTIETEILTYQELGGDLGKGFIFDITDMSIGRLSGIESVLPWLTSTLNLDIGTVFSAAGLNIVSDIDNLKLLYPYSNFVQDLSSKAGSTDPLFINIFSNFFTENLIDFTHVEAQHVNGKIDMAPYKENPAYTNPDKVIAPLEEETPWLTSKSNVAQKLLQDGVIANDKDAANNCRSVIKFLAYGQDFLKKAEFTYIESIYDQYLKDTYCGGLSMHDYSVGSDGNGGVKFSVFGDTHAGIMDYVTGEVNKKITEVGKAEYINRIVNDGSAYLFEASNPLPVYDTQVHKMLKANKSLVGYGFSFVGEHEDGSAKLAYAIMDNIYPTIIPANTETNTPNTMSLTFGLNINGCETSLVMPMPGKEVHDGGKHGLSFSVAEAPIYFGTSTFPNLKEQIQSIINDVESEDGMISFVADESGNISKIEMIFDFDDYFEKHPESPFFDLNEEATSHGAVLTVGFDFAASAGSSESKRAGQFNLTLGYVKP